MGWVTQQWGITFLVRIDTDRRAADMDQERKCAMWQSSGGSRHSSAYKIVVAGMATVAISAVGATTTVPTVRTVTMNVAPLAAIDESSDTLDSPTPTCTA